MCQLLIACPLRQHPRRQVLCSQFIHMLAMITGNNFVATFDSVPTSMNRPRCLGDLPISPNVGRYHGMVYAAKFCYVSTSEWAAVVLPIYKTDY